MSGKLPLANPFASASAHSAVATPFLSAFHSAAAPSSSASSGSLPPGLGHSREKSDPWKEHHFQRRVRSLHSLEAFGAVGEAAEEEEDDEDDAWTRSYLTHLHVAPKRAPSVEPSNPLNCRNCDRDFFNEDALRAHVAEHETCGVDGCPYTAHPKLVLNHYKTQHVTGLAGKVWKVRTPEEIAKWREDRKRNFPTAARTARRKREARERRKRGNVLNNQYFGKINGETRGKRNDFRGGGRGVMRGGRGGGGRGGGGGGIIRGGRGMRGGASFRSIANEFASDSDASSSGDDDAFSLPNIDVSHLRHSPTTTTTSGEKESSPTKGSATPSTAGGAGILGSLASAYASSSDDEGGDGGGGRGGTREGDDGGGGVEEEERRNSKEDDKKNGGVDDDKAESQTRSTEKTSKKKKRKRKKRKGGDEKPEVVERLLTDGQVKYQLTKKRQRREPTLLERLLAPEIRRERNVILQCVRYIVRKNFFLDH